MRALCLFLLIVGGVSTRGETVFEDDFSGPELKPGWTWVREAPEEWRIKDGALELRAQHGRIWSGNDARNVLLAPTPAEGDFTATVSVSQKADQKWEQVGLLFYVHDDRYVKLISEFIEGQNYIVLGRESKDTGEKNKVFAKLKIPSSTVTLRSCFWPCPCPGPLMVQLNVPAKGKRSACA